MTEKVHLDIDPGCDDILAVGMALGHPDIEVVGISTVAGNTTVENATQNICSLLAVMDRTDVPVAVGCGRPIVDELRTAEDIHGPGGFHGDLPEQGTTAIETGTHGSSFILKQVREYGNDLSLLATGPLTNLAVALAMDPPSSERVGGISVMGGNPFVSGNVTPAAEANFHNDPIAARRVLDTATPTVAGLNVTSSAMLSSSVLSSIELSDRRREILTAGLNYRDRGEKGAVIHDAVIVANLVESVLTVERRDVEIDTSLGPSRGAFLVKPGEPNGNSLTAAVAIDIDVDQFNHSFVKGIRGLKDSS